MKRLCAFFLTLTLLVGFAGCSNSVTTESEVEKKPSCWAVDSYEDDFGDSTNDMYLRGVFQGTFSHGAETGSQLETVVFYDDPSSVDTYFSFRLLEYGNSSATYDSDEFMRLNLKIDGSVYTTQLFPDPLDGDLDFWRILPSKHKESSCIETNPREVVWDALLKAMREGQTVSCNIVVGDTVEQLDQALGGNSGTQYTFKIDGTGFEEQEKQLD